MGSASIGETTERGVEQRMEKGWKRRGLKKGMTGEKGAGERRGKTHRPIVPEAGNPRVDHLSVAATSEKLLAGWLAGWLDWLVAWLLGWLLGWLVGWLVGRRQRSVWREENAEPKWSTREIRKKMSRSGTGASRWVDGEANDTSLGNFNFAEITVGANKNKEISLRGEERGFTPSLFLLRSSDLPLHHPLFSPRSFLPLSGRARYVVSHQRHYTTVSTTRVPNRVYVRFSFFQFCVCPYFSSLVAFPTRSLFPKTRRHARISIFALKERNNSALNVSSLNKRIL